MSDSPDTFAQLRQVREQLSAPIPDSETVLRLLCLPLDLLDLLDNSLLQYGSDTRPPPPVKRVILAKWIPSLQSTILDRVLVDWHDALLQTGQLEETISQYFCPNQNSSPEARLVALSAYDVLLDALSRHGPDREFRKLPDISVRFVLDMLSRLSTRYSVDNLHRGLFDSAMTEDSRDLSWNDCVQNIVAVPSKVSNFVGERGSIIPESLLSKEYFEHLSMSFEALVHRTAITSKSENEMSSILDSLSVLLQKLVRVGLFPSDFRTQPLSFFRSALRMLRRRLLVPLDSEAVAASMSYSFLWQRLFATLTMRDAQQIFRSFLSCLELPASFSTSTASRQEIKRTSLLLHRMFGKLSRKTDTEKERWENVVGVTALSTNNEWNVGIARATVCWASGLANSSIVDIRSIESLSKAVLGVWSDQTFVKHSTRTRHEYITTMLLLTISYLPPNDEGLVSLSRNAAFLQAITTYLEHPDPTIRRLGLLVAEVLSSATASDGKALSFGAEMWEGAGDGKELCRQLRALIKETDGEADLVLEDELPPSAAAPSHDAPPKSTAKAGPSIKPVLDTAYDSDDDSLAGYDSPRQGRSRTPSPTPEDLEEIEKDPTLNNPTKKRVPKPVYLADLGKLFHDSKEPEKVQVGLSSAVDLIRRKKDYGTELEENAVNLTHAAIGLQDDFNLADFEQTRQAMLVALVACCPRKAAPAIIEQFFHHQYSVAQRSAMLTALTQGARELAGLGVSEYPSHSFPTKLLPAAQHARYVAMEEDKSPVQRTIEGITRLVIDRQASAAETEVPAIAREKQLRIRKTSRPVTDLSKPVSALSATGLKDIAAEFFIIPFVNRFWLYLRDEQTREQRTAQSSSRYRGAGTGMVLSSLMLSQILATLGVLMDAARHSPTFLAVLAPEVLELAATIGNRAMTTGATMDGQNNQQAGVVMSALQLSLIIVDASMELDGGRTLAMEHAQLVAGIGEWARQLFENEDKGIRLEGAGSVAGANLERVAASVILKVHSVLEKWRGSMITGIS